MRIYTLVLGSMALALTASAAPELPRGMVRASDSGKVASLLGQDQALLIQAEDVEPRPQKQTSIIKLINKIFHFTPADCDHSTRESRAQEIAQEQAEEIQRTLEKARELERAYQDQILAERAARRERQQSECKRRQKLVQNPARREQNRKEPRILTGAEAAHAHQRWLNEEYAREQRLLKQLQK